MNHLKRVSAWTDQEEDPEAEARRELIKNKNKANSFFQSHSHVSGSNCVLSVLAVNAVPSQVKGAFRNKPARRHLQTLPAHAGRSQRLRNN